MGGAEGRIRTASLLVIAAILSAVALRELKPALIPFSLAMLLTYAVAPGVDFVHDRLKVPRIVAICVALLVGLLAFVVLGGMITSSVQRLTEDFASYEARFVELAGRLGGWLTGLGLVDAGTSLTDHLAKLPFKSWGQSLAQGVADMASQTFLVLVFSVYLLLGYRADEKSEGLRGHIEARIRRYISIKLWLSALTGLLVGVFLALIGVKLALVFGLLAFILNFIPNIGSILATLLPLPVVLFSPDTSTTTVVLAMVLPGAVQLVVGNVLEPKLMGESLELHPVTILLALVVWGILWGIPGMLLATPITAVIRIFLAELPLTKPLADLMGGVVPGGAEPDEPESRVDIPR